MRTDVIWKFDVPPEGPIEIPKGAEILTVQIQHEKPVLWAIVDPEAPKVKRVAQVFGTGHEVPKGVLFDNQYVGTFQAAGGTFIWHLFLGPELNTPQNEEVGSTE